MASPTGQLPAGLPGTGDLLWTGSFISTRPAQDFIAFDGVSRDWWVAQGGKTAWTKVGNTVGFGYAPLGCAVWIGDFAGTGHSQVLFYYPGDKEWYLGQFTGTQLGWSQAGDTTGFGQVWDGRPFWTGDFTGSGKTEILFYYPGDKEWYLGQFTGTQLGWSQAGDTTGFGQVWDGRPFWTGDFTGSGKTEILFYYPGDKEWYLGQFTGTQLGWSQAGDTTGFGQVWDGRPFWTGDFTGSGKTEILFYYPGDKEWYLGQFTGTQLGWSQAGDTTGFGQVWDGRPFWTGDFTGSGKTEILFYYPGDKEWYLGQFTGTQLGWSQAGDTTGFGQVWDGRPFWTGNFTGSGKTDVMFYYPGDNNWYLAVYTGNQFQWSLAGNGIPRVLELSMQSQQQTEWCWSATSVSVNHFYNSGSTWTQCQLVNNAFGQTTCCNDGSTSQCNQPWYIDQALQIVKNFVSSGSAVAPTDVDSQVNNGHPLEVGIEWSGGGGHAVVIDGYQGTGTAELLSIRDPAYGDSWVSHSTFKSSYQGSGTWDQTCYTQS